MSTLIRIPMGYMRFVPAYRQSDEATADLSPAKWKVGLIIIANAKRPGALLTHDRIQSILAPTVQATCRLKPEETLFFPTPGGGGGTHPHQHYYLYRCCGDGRDPHRHAGGTSSHTHGPFHIFYPRLDMHIRRFHIQPPNHKAPPCQPRYHECKALSPP